jgi:transcription initiation factor TFIIIB Brf1 subunit/transcription initiation factor TFIIB
MSCDECGSPVVPTERGEIVCTKCDLVVQDGIIDSTPVTQRDDAYLGPGGDGRGPALAFQSPSAMTTRPTITTRDAAGRPLGQDAAARMQYLTKVDARIVSNKDRSAKRLQSAVRELTNRLGASSQLEERAFAVARRAVASGEFRGVEFGLVAGGSMYFALFEANGSVDRRAFMPQVRASHENRRESNVLGVFKAIKRILGTVPEGATTEKIALEAAERLGLSGEVVRLIRQNLTLFPRSAIPRIDAASVIYISGVQGGAKLSQRRVAAECGTNDVSLRSRLHQAFKYSRGDVEVQA